MAATLREVTWDSCRLVFFVLFLLLLGSISICPQSCSESHSPRVHVFAPKAVLFGVSTTDRKYFLNYVYLKRLESAFPVEERNLNLCSTLPPFHVLIFLELFTVLPAYGSAVSQYLVKVFYTALKVPSTMALSFPDVSSHSIQPFRQLQSRLIEEANQTVVLDLNPVDNVLIDIMVPSVENPYKFGSQESGSFSTRV